MSMTHLKIEQSRSNEEVLSNDSVVVKICEIIDNDSLDDTSKLTGIIRVPGTYDKYIDKINNNHTDKYKNFEVKADNTYIWFEDPNVEAALKACYNLTTKGVMSSQIGDANVHYMNKLLFQNSNNNDPNQYGQVITSFNELPKLTNITEIPDKQFQNCANLTSIDLSNITGFNYGVNNDACNYFAGCTKLTNLGDTSKLVNLGGGGTFISCGISSFYLSPSITVIPGYTFYRCHNLRQVTGGGAITTLGYNCFRECENLTTVPSFQSVTTISGCCFYGCSKLTQVNLSTNLTSIPNNFFQNCGSLTTVTGLSNITSITYDVFNGCSNLATVDIDWSKLTSIQERVFLGCTNLNISVDLSNVTFLGQRAFESSGITSITQLNQNVSLGVSTFNSCKSLTTVNNICKLSNSTFNGCSNLTTVTGLSNITSIPGNAFRSCGNLTSVDIDFQNITKIEDYTFYNCSNLEFNSHLNLSSVTSIGQNAFYNCAKLVIDEFPRVQRYYTQTFTSIGNTTITIPKEVEQMDNQCFGFCINLTTVLFEPNSQITSMVNTFRHCPNLTGTVDIPEGLTTSSGSFYECYKLKHVIYPSTTTSIGHAEFMYDDELVSITVKATTPPTIMNETFSHAPNNLIIYVPSESVSAYQSAQYWSLRSSKIQAIPTS